MDGFIISDNNLVTMAGRYLEEKRLEGQKDNDAKIGEVRKVGSVKVASNSEKGGKPIRKQSYSPPKRVLQRSR